MKKFMQNVFVRALCVLILGIILVVYSGEVSRWMIMASGVLFILPGLVGILGYFRRDKKSRQYVLYPLIALGSILFGVVQMVLPDLFFEALRYVLAAVMFVLAVSQLYTLWNVRSGGVKISWLYFLFPLAGVGASGFVVFYRPFAAEDVVPLTILGVTFILYALLELWSIVLVKRAVVKPGSEQLPEEVEKLK